MIDLCERLQDRFAILDGPPTRDIGEVRKWRARTSSSYAALYYPWVRRGPERRASARASVGAHRRGLLARRGRVGRAQGARQTSSLRGVSAVALELREDDLGQLNAEAVNSIRNLPGRGVRLWSARTLSDDPSWRYVNVRRLFIMLRRAIELGTQWAVFESNDPRTWETLSREVGIFLEGLWNKGAFAGPTPQALVLRRVRWESQHPGARRQRHAHDGDRRGADAACRVSHLARHTEERHRRASNGLTQAEPTERTRWRTPARE